MNVSVNTVGHYWPAICLRALRFDSNGLPIRSADYGRHLLRRCGFRSRNAYQLTGLALRTSTS